MLIAAKTLVLMLDSNIADHIVSAQIAAKMARLVGAGAVRFVKTSAQDVEHAATRDGVWRRALQGTFATFERVPPAVFVLDAENNLGEARFGSPEDDALYDAIFIRNPKHSGDGIIGVTAAKEADVLVTEDTRLTKRLAAERPTLQVWDFETFRAYVDSEHEKL